MFLGRLRYRLTYREPWGVWDTFQGKGGEGLRKAVPQKRVFVMFSFIQVCNSEIGICNITNLRLVIALLKKINNWGMFFSGFLFQVYNKIKSLSMEVCNLHLSKRTFYVWITCGSLSNRVQDRPPPPWKLKTHSFVVAIIKYLETEWDQWQLADPPHSQYWPVSVLFSHNRRGPRTSPVTSHVNILFRLV